MAIPLNGIDFQPMNHWQDANATKTPHVCDSSNHPKIFRETSGAYFYSGDGPALSNQIVAVTRRKVAGMDVRESLPDLFCALKRVSNSFCRSAARPFFSAASNAVMVGP